MPLFGGDGTESMSEFSTEGVVVDRIDEVERSVTALVEGLPGVGMVGKLAVEHLLEEREDTLIARFHSEHFPPQIAVDADGVASLPEVELHQVRAGGTDLLLLSGDYQAASGIGHYRLTTAVLDVAEDLGVETIYAIGGVPTGELVDDPAVIGTVADPTFREPLETAGVRFREKELSGGVVGISGLLVGLGDHRGLAAACLMGETSGYVVDPNSARAVLCVLEEILDLDIDYTSLVDRAEQMESFVRQLQERQEEQAEMQGEEDLRYIG